MTPTPRSLEFETDEHHIKAFEAVCECVPTEMGIRITVKNPAVIVMCEFDVEQPQEYLRAMLGCFPQIVEETIAKVARDAEAGDESG